MGSRLPEIPPGQFRDRLAAAVDFAVPERVAADLHRHYLELRRWNPRVSLVGPGDAPRLVERHYGESLAALPRLGAGDRTLVDVGSGAGFPGLVLAAARRSLAVTLVEPRQKKWHFLRAAARRIGLSCRCLDARVEAAKKDAVLPAGLPSEIDVVTCRALKLPPEVLALFHRHSPRARFLLWYGEGLPELPKPLAVRDRWALAGSRRRRILEIRAEP